MNDKPEFPGATRIGLVAALNGHDAIQRLPVGANAPAPLNHVPEHLLLEVAQVLSQITRHPSRALSGKELRQIAEKGMAQVYIYERRLKVMRQLLDGFRDQLAPLDPDEPLAIAFKTIYNSFDKTLKGEHR